MQWDFVRGTCGSGAPLPVTRDVLLLPSILIGLRFGRGNRAIFAASDTIALWM